MGGGSSRAAHQAPLAARPSSRHPCAPSRHTCASLSSFLRRQEPAPPPSFPRPLPPFLRPPPSLPRPPPSFLRPLSSYLRPLRHSCAGRNHPTPTPISQNSSLPPSRGEVRWGVGSPERPPAAEPQPAPSKAHPHSLHLRAPHAVIPAPPLRHSCAGRNPRNPPAPPSSATPAPPPSHLRPPLVIPAQAGTTRPKPEHPSPTPADNPPACSN